MGKAQASVELLLLLGGAVLIGIIVVGVIFGVGGSAGTQAGQSTQTGFDFIHQTIGPLAGVITTIGDDFDDGDISDWSQSWDPSCGATNCVEFTASGTRLDLRQVVNQKWGRLYKDLSPGLANENYEMTVFMGLSQQETGIVAGGVYIRAMPSAGGFQVVNYSPPNQGVFNQNIKVTWVGGILTLEAPPGTVIWSGATINNGIFGFQAEASSGRINYFDNLSIRKI